MKLRRYMILALTVTSAQTALADPSYQMPTTEFQMIIHQNAGTITGLNIAMGSGSDVSFFSNIDDLTSWNEADGPVRTGTYSPAGGQGVLLGVCAGGQCDVSQGISFTTPVGQ